MANAARTDTTKAVWGTGKQNDLPDASFAHIEDGGEQDEEGKTTPRRLRHYPYKDADGTLDAAHVRNGLSRAASAIKKGGKSAEIAQKALPTLQRAAKTLGIGEDNSKEKTVTTDTITAPVADAAKQGTATAAAEKARAPKPSDQNAIHPFKGVHNHAHDDGTGGIHQHAHMHDDDDVHDHPHLNGKDARMLSPEDREQALAIHQATRNVGSNGYFAANPDTTKAPKPDATKAAPDFNAADATAPAVSTPDRPSSTLATVRAMLKDITATVESLADETDQDRDGDVDTDANMAGPMGDNGTPAVDLVSELGGTDVASRETLDLTFHTKAYLEKYIKTQVETALAARSTEDFLTKAAAGESLAAIPEIAKLAGGIAKGLEALADRTKATTEELTATKAALTTTQADLEEVKKRAAPPKGSVFAIEKGIGIEPDRVYRDGIVPDAELRKAAAVKALAGLSDDERRRLGAEVLKEMYGARG